MAETFDSPSLYAEHLPETHRTLQADRSVSEDVLPGHISVGVVLNGVKKELYRFKAGGLLDDLRRQRETQQGQPAAQQDQSQQFGQ